VEARTSTEVVRAYVDACNRDVDVEVFRDLLDDDVEMHESDVLPAAVHVKGIEEVLRYLERFTTHWSAGEWRPEEVVENGDRVYMRARLLLTGRRSGIEIDRVWRYVFTVRDGRLLRQDGFDDDAEARRAAGL
jgi:ketosteroid isomerase-like protein